MSAVVIAPRPYRLCLAFMAGLSFACGLSARLYVDQLVACRFEGTRWDDA